MTAGDCLLFCLGGFLVCVDVAWRSLGAFRWWALGLLVLLAMAIAGARGAYAQDHHPLHRDFYRNWKEPLNPDASCCNARIETDGRETGDCEPTRAELRRGDWYVWMLLAAGYGRLKPAPGGFRAHQGEDP